MPDQLSDPVPSPRPTFVQDFRRFFLRGLALILPPILTVWLLVAVWDFLDTRVDPFVGRLARYGAAWIIAEWRSQPPVTGGWTRLGSEGPYVRTKVYDTVQEGLGEAAMTDMSVIDLHEKYILFSYWEPYYLSFVGLMVAAVIIYFLGRFLATFIGRSIWQVTEQTVFRLPIVRAVYPHVKQFIDFLISERKIEYNRVVAVEYPRRGIWSLGLVTGEGIQDLEQATGQESLTIFVPYSPWSMTGYAITAPRKEVLDLNVTVDEAIRFVVSGGVIRPPRPGEPTKPWQRAVALESESAGAVGDRAVHVRRLPRGPTRRLRVGTRGSQLARIQSQWVIDQLRPLAAQQEIELVEVQTGGDRNKDAKLTEIGGEGVFTKEIQRALLAGEIDIAVHSLKDLLTTPVPGLTVAAVPRRASPLDVLVAPKCGDWRALPPRARVATGSPRRRSQLLRLRSDLVITPIRGNVPTRLQKLEQEDLEAIVLAHAGLRRLDLEGHITHYFAPDEMLPAPGQGALAVECRADDPGLIDLLSGLDDAATRQATAAERGVLRGLQGGCHLPLGTIATVSDEVLSLRAGLFTPDGSREWLESLAGPVSDAEGLGRRLADRLLDAGAREVIESEQELDHARAGARGRTEQE